MAPAQLCGLLEIFAWVTARRVCQVRKQFWDSLKEIREAAGTPRETAGTVRTFLGTSLASRPRVERALLTFPSFLEGRRRRRRKTL